MNIRTLLVPPVLLAAFVGFAQLIPTGRHSAAELPTITSRQYRVDPYIVTAIELQSIGRTNALTRLRIMAQDQKFETPVIILCRMLFTKRLNSEFRRPMIGEAHFLNGTVYANWPGEPIEIVDGVPFLITRGYDVVGFPEPDKWYLRYCETNCDWSSFRYSVKTQPQKQDALNKFLASPKWKKPLEPYDKQFLAEQIQ